MPKRFYYHDFHYRSRQRFFTAFLACATSLLGLGLIFALTTGFLGSASTKTDSGQSQAASTNLVKNGTFNTNTGSWSLTGSAIFTAAAPIPKFDGTKSAKIEVKSPISTSSLRSIQQEGFYLKRGASYNLSFTATQSKGHKLSANLTGATSKTFTLSPSWKSYSATFTISKVSTNEILSFTLETYAQPKDIYYIDNVSLKEITKGG